MTAAVYLDTSALAKWYLNEAGSDEFEAFLRQERVALISRLTVLEFRCLLARRRRSREFSKAVENQIFKALQSDIGAGSLTVQPLEDTQVVAAAEIVERLHLQPLRSLDALHLAIAQELGVARIATADRVMAQAAEALGLRTVRFDSGAI